MNIIYNNIYPIGLTILSLGLILWAYLHRRAVVRILTICFYLLPIGALVSGFLMLAKEPEIRIKKVMVEVPKEKEQLNDLLAEIPAVYGVPEIVARAIVEQESGGNMEAIRFEPGQMSRAAKITKNVEQQRMLASSHCALQIMGWHSPALGLKWTDLYDPRTCVEAGMKIFSDCLNRAKNTSKYDKIYSALACYNGSEKYAKEVMGSISRRLVEESL